MGDSFFLFQIMHYSNNHFLLNNDDWSIFKVYKCFITFVLVNQVWLLMNAYSFFFLIVTTYQQLKNDDLKIILENLKLKWNEIIIKIKDY